MKVIKYKIDVQDDPVHSYTRRSIDEVYIHDYKIYFNSEGHVFRQEGEPRYLGQSIEEVEMNISDANRMIEYTDLKMVIDNLISNFFQ